VRKIGENINGSCRSQFSWTRKYYDFYGLGGRGYLLFQGDPIAKGKRRLVLPNVRDFSIVTPWHILKK